MDPILSFMTAVLGASGAQALAKATERRADLSYALVPRTILAWLQSNPAYEGALPGIDDSYVSFRKSTDGFTGQISVGGGLHAFEDATLFHLVGAVAVALRLDQESAPPTVRDLDLQRLGKSIDVLAKVQSVNARLAKAEPPAKKPLDAVAKYGRLKCKKSPTCRLVTGHKEECNPDPPAAYRLDPPVKKDELEKAGTGVPAAPTAPKPPTPPLAPNATPPKAAKPPASPTMKLTRSEAQHECGACGLPQFYRDTFRGCMCFSAFAKSVEVVSAAPEAIVLRFDPEDWGPDELLVFRESIGRDS